MSSEQISIVFLDLVISKEGISVDPSRIQIGKFRQVSSSVHFVLFRVDQSAKVLADNYMRDIVQLHDIPLNYCV